MTTNQRRPGFRLPWSPETDGLAPEDEFSASAANPVESVPTPVETEAEAEAAPSTASGAADGSAAAAWPVANLNATAETAPTAAADSGGDEFMRDLVAAMRGVADEARQTTVAELQSTADERVRSLETDADARREELRARAEADVAGVGDWANAESERIKAEAEARVVARRAKLEHQIGAETAKTEGETEAVRGRVAEYERELAVYYAQLDAINDPAAFAAAAKRMPRPPALSGAPAASAAAATSAASPAPTVKPEDEAPVEPATASSNGVPVTSPEVHPAEEEVLTARLAELDAALAGDAAAVATAVEPVTTEIVVKGLGSFGAITGFRQALSGVNGIEGVALSLGHSGEFVFRATHAAGFDVRSAITTLEGDAAKVEDRPEGGLRVTLGRAR